MTGSARNVFPMVCVEDTDAAVAFYGQLLGGEETYRRSADGEPSFIVLRLGTSEVGLAVMRALGVPVVLEPVEQPWGETVSYVSDPDGNIVMLTA